MVGVALEAGVGRGRPRDRPAAAPMLFSTRCRASARDDLGWIAFDDYHLARLTGTVAFMLIPLERIPAAGQGKDWR